MVVRQVEIDAVHTETLEALLELPLDPFRGEPVVSALLHWIERLGRELGAAPA